VEPSRSSPIAARENSHSGFNKRLHELRWHIESAFNSLKDFRRIATRYDKLPRNYLASIYLVA